MIWMPITILVILAFLLVVLPLIQLFLDMKGRRVFYGKACPACQRLYDPRAVRRAKHVMSSKVFGGPPPAPFSAYLYEAWELRCAGCGHVQEYDAGGNAIVFEDQTPGGTDSIAPR